GAAPRGACCRADGTCGENDTELACKAGAGAWSGAGTTCASAACAGACCVPSGACQDNQTVSSCTAASGSFQGLKTSCASLPTPCPLPPCHNPWADADG